MRIRGKHLGFVAIFLLWLFIVAVPVALWYELAGPGYYAELNAIRREFGKIPGIRLIDCGGNEDLTIEGIYAEVEIPGKGSIKFLNLTMASFEKAKRIDVCAVGPYKFIIEGEEIDRVIDSKTGRPVISRFIGYSINVAPGGDCATLFPFRMENVRDVIEHYDAIYAELAKWPKAPAANHIKTSKGFDFSYCTETR